MVLTHHTHKVLKRFFFHDLFNFAKLGKALIIFHIIIGRATVIPKCSLTSTTQNPKNKQKLPRTHPPSNTRLLKTLPIFQLRFSFSVHKKQRYLQLFTRGGLGSCDSERGVKAREKDQLGPPRHRIQGPIQTQTPHQCQTETRTKNKTKSPYSMKDGKARHKRRLPSPFKCLSCATPISFSFSFSLSVCVLGESPQGFHACARETRIAFPPSSPSMPMVKRLSSSLSYRLHQQQQ